VDDLACQLVSIIVVSYNYGRYLPTAIKSALAQSYRNIEVVVADDGSDDGSAGIASGFPVKVLRLRHGGMAKAVDAGVRACKGAFIVILTADDALHPDFARETMAVLGKGRAAYAYTQAVGFGAGSFYFKPPEFSVKTLLEKPHYMLATATMRKEAYLEAGSYDPSLSFMEDWDFYLKLAENGGHGVLVPKPLLFYRQHQGQRGTRGPWEYYCMCRKIRQRHAALFAKNLGARDRLDIFASDCALFAYMAARDVLAALHLWEPARKGMVKVAALLQPGYAYSNDVPESCRQMVKKLDSKNR